MLTCLVPVLFTFYIQGVLKLKKNNSGAKRLTGRTMCYTTHQITVPRVFRQRQCKTRLWTERQQALRISPGLNLFFFLLLNLNFTRCCDFATNLTSPHLYICSATHHQHTVAVQHTTSTQSHCNTPPAHTHTSRPTPNYTKNTICCICKEIVTSIAPEDRRISPKHVEVKEHK